MTPALPHDVRDHFHHGLCTLPRLKPPSGDYVSAKSKCAALKLVNGETKHTLKATVATTKFGYFCKSRHALPTQSRTALSVSSSSRCRRALVVVLQCSSFFHPLRLPYLPTLVTMLFTATADEGLAPAIVAKSGDIVEVETVSGGAARVGSEYVRGDTELEKILGWGPNGPNLSPKGPFGGFEGPHILTGPIYVCDAEPGDVMQIGA